MKNVIAAFAFLMIAVLCSHAQSNEIKRAEFFVGYSHGSAGVDFSQGNFLGQVYRGRTGQDGFNASGVVNFSRYVGIKGDVSGTYRSGGFTFQVPSGIQSNPTVNFPFDARTSLYNFLGGVQVKDNASERRLAPFAHALVGAGRRRNMLAGGGFACITIIPCPGSTKETGLAGAFGGGLDVRLNKRIGVRLFQLDYNPIKFDDRTDHNLRFSTGLVF